MQRSGKCLILACHGVYEKGQWHAEDRYRTSEAKEVFQEHLKISFEALRSGDCDVLIISGGYTKEKTEKSEARGMLDWAWDMSEKGQLGSVTINDIRTWIASKKIVLEEFARDSFENILFSVCRFFQLNGKIPASICVCSMRSKEDRFRTICNELGFSDFSYKGKGEENKGDRRLSEIKGNPFHRGTQFYKTRRSRDPWEKGNPYISINDEFKKMLDILDLMDKRDVVNYKIVPLPF